MAATLLLSLVVASPNASATEPIASAPGSKITASPTSDVAFVAAINAVRANHGLTPLRVQGSMASAAASWTSTMVSTSTLAHAPNITGGAPAGWVTVGENVGRGRTVDSLMNAFMASPTHRKNILDERFTHVATASAIGDDGKIYTTHRFAHVASAAPAVVSAPAAVAKVDVPVADRPASDRIVGKAAKSAAFASPGTKVAESPS